jgi:hypothetical protein
MKSKMGLVWSFIFNKILYRTAWVAKMDDGGSYHLRRNLEYVKQKPKFLQNILDGQSARETADNDRRSRAVRIDDEPVLVDSEGNAIPEELLERDMKLDSAFSGIHISRFIMLDMVEIDDFEDDSKLIEEHLDDRSRERPSKRSKPQPAKQLSKLKSDTRLLSFHED